MTPVSLSIDTGSRLHFGLLSWGAQYPRQFGGLGLMIDQPGLQIRVEPGSGQVKGPLAGRVEKVVERLRAEGLDLPPFQIRIDAAPPEHVGLGTGTQLSLAVARILTEFMGRANVPAPELARLTGRGLRSGVGLHGFDVGGLVVDGGRKGNEGVPPLLTRLAFPEDWSVLVMLPEGPTGLHGTDERGAFVELPSVSANVCDRLCRLVLLELLPAVIERDLPAFGAALEEIQLRVGQAFAPAQGAPFAHPQFNEIAQTLKAAGLVGVGQSSWGPALYGFSQSADPTVIEQISTQFDVARGQIFWTRARNRNATITRSDATYSR